MMLSSVTKTMRHAARKAGTARSASSLSFASPESDFSRPTPHEIAVDHAHPRQYNSTALSFATPHADFMAPTSDHIFNESGSTSTLTHSDVSYATPFADMAAPTEHEMQHVLSTDDHPTTISYGTPFSDFSSPTPCHVMSAPSRSTGISATTETLLHDTNITYGSPYSDFVAAHSDGHEDPMLRGSHDPVHITYSTPFSDVVAPSTEHILSAPELPEEDTHPHISYSTALADFTAPHENEVMAPPEELVQHDVEHISFSTPYADVFAHTNHGDEVNHYEEDATGSVFFTSLPKKIDEALASSSQSQQARVITEAKPPFRITYVNDAWIGLCGFSSQEAVGNSLSILQGEHTDREVLQRIHQETIERQLDHMSFNLINYKKNGNEFANHLRVVPLRNEENQVTHFLGVLEDAAAKYSNTNLMQA